MMGASKGSNPELINAVTLRMGNRSASLTNAETTLAISNALNLAGRQAGRQAGRRAGVGGGGGGGRGGAGEAGGAAGRRPGGQAGGQTDRQTDRLTDRLTDRHSGRQADRKTHKHAGGQAGRQGTNGLTTSRHWICTHRQTNKAFQTVVMMDLVVCKVDFVPQHPLQGLHLLPVSLACHHLLHCL